ncbi:MAG: dienelactone hydrolase family protein [Bordetella sp.]|nr:dienelactone hydrolase family protein [Bordetella sp.]
MKTSHRLVAALATLSIASSLAGVLTAEAQEAEAAPAAPADVRGERVVFMSRDEVRTELVGYLFRPTAPVEGAAPAVVLMHGRAGAYSSLADGVYEARTLTQRHRYWAEYWASRGYYALVVDSFGPRGHPGGFAAGTYSERPADVNEVTIRPLDAYGALRYLRTLDGVDDDRIGVMGWSNGGSAVLATMADDKPGDMRRIGFRAGIAMYPGCGLQNRFRRQGYKTYAPVEVFMGTADEEVSHDSCLRLTTAARGAGSAIAFHSYPGASHTFDDPGRRRQSVPANAAATGDVRARAAAFFAEALAPR